MRQEFAVHIVEAAATEKRDATLIVGLTLDEVDEASALWSPFLRAQLRESSRLPQHAGWDWRLKARTVKGLLPYSLLGVTVEGEMQAMMLWDDAFSKARHPLQLGKVLVYIHFLSTAPWNDRQIVPAPKFRGCGSLLLSAAVEHSIDLEYKGRVGLHSLPQAEEFYGARCGMIDLGVDYEHEDLRYFEFTPESSQQFLTN